MWPNTTSIGPTAASSRAARARRSSRMARWRLFAFAQRVPVVAHDMEHPEHRAGPAQELRNVAVAPPHHIDQALEICRVAYVLRREGASLDEIEHENARLGVHHARAQARQMRRPARCQLVRPHHPVNRDIAADPHDVAAAAILDCEILIGDAAGERHEAPRARTRSQARRRAPMNALAPYQGSRVRPSLVGGKGGCGDRDREHGGDIAKLKPPRHQGILPGKQHSIIGTGSDGQPCVSTPDGAGRGKMLSCPHPRAELGHFHGPLPRIGEAFYTWPRS